MREAESRLCYLHGSLLGMRIWLELDKPMPERGELLEWLQRRIDEADEALTAFKEDENDG